MAVETATTIADLNAAWPLGNDPKGEGDNHIRAIKTALKTTFPGVDNNGFNTPILATEQEINYLQQIRSNIQAQIDAKSPTSSPTFTGTPKAPTPTAGNTTQQIPNCSWVQTEIASSIETTNSLPKFFLRATSAGVISASDNISSITDLGIGKIQVNIANDFTGSYAVVDGCQLANESSIPVSIYVVINSSGQFTGYSKTTLYDLVNGNLIDSREFTDPVLWFFAGFGANT